MDKNKNHLIYEYVGNSGIYHIQNKNNWQKSSFYCGTDIVYTPATGNLEDMSGRRICHNCMRKLVAECKKYSNIYTTYTLVDELRKYNAITLRKVYFNTSKEIVLNFTYLDNELQEKEYTIDVVPDPEKVLLNEDGNLHYYHRGYVRFLMNAIRLELSHSITRVRLWIEATEEELY